MRDTELYAQILGIQSPWNVDCVDFLKDKKEVCVTVSLSKAGYCCPECGKPCNGYDVKRRRWRHLDTCQYSTFIEADVPRVECKEHGIHSVGVPWAEEKSRFTILLERFVIDLLHEAPISVIARWTGLSWSQVDDLNDETTANVGEIIEDSKVGEKSVVAHGTPDGKIRFEGGVYDAKSFYDNFLADVMDDNTKIINLYVCLGGYGGDASLAQELADYASQKRSRSIVVRAAVGYVKPIGFSFAGKELFTFNKDRLVGTTGKSGDIKVSNPQWKYFYGKIY